MALARTSSEKASPLIERLHSPASLAYVSNAAELYQPALPVFFSVPGFSKNTPRVAAP